MLTLLAEGYAVTTMSERDALVSMLEKTGQGLGSVARRQQCMPGLPGDDGIGGISANKALDSHARLIYIFQYIAKSFHKRW